MALLDGSPAIDAVPEGVNACGTEVVTDQRGVERPLDGDGDDVLACDIGAYEKGSAFQSFLPLILNNHVLEKDLVITELSTTGGTLSVTIMNQGNVAIVEDFWVDLYLDPNPVPAGANDVWQLLSDYGAAWGVTKDLAPGESLTLTLNDDYYDAVNSNMPGNIASGTILYAQVDSAHAQTNYGSVAETDETNNIAGPLTASNAVPTASVWSYLSGLLSSGKILVAIRRR